MAAVAVLALVAVLAAYVQIQQRILRWRAERLLADIRDIQMGKSTWADAQRLMTRWGAWGAYEGSCTAKRCDYHIEMDDSLSTLLIHYQWLGESYGWLGGRGAAVVGGFVVRDGIVWGRSFEMQLDVRGLDGGYYYTLMARATSVSRFSDGPTGWIIRHPEYYVGMPGACEDCASIYARFTPFADPVVVRGLMTDINLDCLTRYFPCTKEADVMPATWKQVMAERSQGYDRQAIKTCQFPMELLGRDPRYVAIADVVSNRLTPEWGSQTQLTTFRLRKQLKGSRLLNPGESVEAPVASSMVYGSSSDRGQELTPGRSFILAIDDQVVRGPGQNPSPEISECGIIPLTEENFAAIERGIQHDVLRGDPDPDIER